MWVTQFGSKPMSHCPKSSLPTPISRPLYVGLADQTGHIVEKQIIKITDGEGHGQFHSSCFFYPIQLL
ncbi:hypothetical protein [Bacteroides thetaiotaomicron]|uniref:hypothetical protein n=1 Tax=Bacteroides thetaiotaomicron TaxID=818 RepID=UPI00216601D8|nr:hypothetical protein [Bacteroides thetaiotaomicron]MCS2487295.1 hypothetical protein [Bacteroides thetaiotaomicron]